MYTFLADNGNKDELFKFLASELAEKMNMSGCDIVTTQREYVLSTKNMDTDSIQSCDLEEGDTRVFLHLKHAVLQGHKIVFLLTVDTDLVVATAISIFNSLKDLGLSECKSDMTRADSIVISPSKTVWPRECFALLMLLGYNFHHSREA